MFSQEGGKFVGARYLISWISLFVHWKLQVKILVEGTLEDGKIGKNPKNTGGQDLVAYTPHVDVGNA